MIWQPIGTAPKKGRFLVYTPTDMRRPMQIAEAHEKIRVIGSVFAFDAEPPTHWAPLPEPPIEKETT